MSQGSEVVFSFNSMNPPNSDRIEARVSEIGQQIFQLPRFHFLKKNFWYSKLIELSTKDSRIKTQLFRFVDVLPVLQSIDQKKEHLLEYLSPQQGGSWPLSLRGISALTSVPVLSHFIVKLSDFQVRKMAQNFIVGESLKEVLPRLLRARQNGMGFTLDILGEAVLSDEEAKLYQEKYLK